MTTTDMKLLNEIMQAYELVIVLTWAFNTWSRVIKLDLTNKIRCCKWGS